MSNDSTNSVPHREILVVEDNTSDRKFLSDILTKAGYQVRPASDGELALRSVQAKLPGLILLDIKMPGMSGVEVCRRLKADQRTRDLPVIFISALGETELKVQALEAGGVDYVTKPVAPSEVLARISTHLAMHRLQQRLEAQTEELMAEIEERKRVEKRLTDSERRSRAWLDSSPVCTKIVDLDFNLQFMSAAGIEQLRIDDITQFYGRPYPLPFYPDLFRNLMVENLERARDTGNTITQEAPVADTEGNELWYHSTLVPVTNDEGRVEYIIVVSIETTERKRAEEELEKQREHLEVLVEERTASLRESEKALAEENSIRNTLIEALPHPAMLIRRDRTVLFANKIAREVGAVVGGRCWQDFGHGDHISDEQKAHVNQHEEIPPGGTQ